MSKRHIVIALLLSFIMLACAAWGKEKPEREVLYLGYQGSIEANAYTIFPWVQVAESFKLAIYGNKKIRIVLVDETTEHPTECRLYLQLQAYWWPSDNTGKARLIWWLDTYDDDGKKAPSSFSAITSNESKGMYTFMLKESKIQGRRARAEVLKRCSND